MPTKTRQNGKKFLSELKELMDEIHSYDCKMFLQLGAGFGRVMLMIEMLEKVLDKEPENYDAYFSTDSLCVLKEIKDDFSNNKYVVTTSGSFGAKVKYNTKETFHIPEELFENLTSSRSSIYFEIVLIGYSESDNTYLATYTDKITVNFELDDNNTVKIRD